MTSTNHIGHSGTAEGIGSREGKGSGACLGNGTTSRDDAGVSQVGCPVIVKSRCGRATHRVVVGDCQGGERGHRGVGGKGDCPGSKSRGVADGELTRIESGPARVGVGDGESRCARAVLGEGGSRPGKHVGDGGSTVIGGRVARSCDRATSGDGAVAEGHHPLSHRDAVVEGARCYIERVGVVAKGVGVPNVDPASLDGSAARVGVRSREGLGAAAVHDQGNLARDDAEFVVACRCRGEGQGGGACLRVGVDRSVCGVSQTGQRLVVPEHVEGASRPRISIGQQSIGGQSVVCSQSCRPADQIEVGVRTTSSIDNQACTAINRYT